MSALALVETPARLADVTGHVFDVQRFCIHDGPGVRTTVFVAGCPLRCAWCHNPRGLKARGGRPRSVGSVLSEVLRDRAFYQASEGGLTLSGGEPLRDVRFASALLQLARAEGLHTCVQTSAAVPWRSFDVIAGLVDLFFIDLKHMDPIRHRALTGADNPEILANIERLRASGAPVALRFPIMPGHNDTAENLAATIAFLKANKVQHLRVVPYHAHHLEEASRFRRPLLAGLERSCPETTLNRVVHIFTDAGIQIEVDA